MTRWLEAETGYNQHSKKPLYFSRNHPCKKIVALLVLVTLIAIIAYLDAADVQGPAAFRNEIVAAKTYGPPKPRATRNVERVTLLAAPGNTTVQMFELITPGKEGTITQLPDLTRCTKLNGPHRVDAGSGIVMHFYMLDCNGVFGYVNEQWVSP